MKVTSIDPTKANPTGAWSPRLLIALVPAHMPIREKSNSPKGSKDKVLIQIIAIIIGMTKTKKRFVLSKLLYQLLRAVIIFIHSGGGVSRKSVKIPSPIPVPHPFPPKIQAIPPKKEAASAANNRYCHFSIKIPVGVLLR